MDMFVIFSRIVYAVYGERATLIEIPVYLVILVITYWLETTGIEPAEPVAFIIAYTRMFFLLCGLMAVGLPPTYVIKKLYDKLTSKLPKKILFWINESRKRYPDWHEYIDCGWWLGFVPFWRLVQLLYLEFPYIAGINMPYLVIEYIFYTIPISGAFYLPLSTTDFMKRKMGIAKIEPLFFMFGLQILDFACSFDIKKMPENFR